MTFYCELNFLKLLVLNFDQKTFSNRTEKQKNYNDFRECLEQKSTKILVNISFDSDTFEDYPFLKELLDNTIIVGNERCLDNINNKEFYEQNDHTKIICTTKNDADCNKMREKYATEFLNTTNFENVWIKYSTRNLKEKNIYEQRITGDYFQNKKWSDLLTFKYPIHSIVIEDPYILESDYGIEFNLIPILDTILPIKQPEMAVHISIYSNNDKDNFRENNQKKLINAIERVFTNYVLEIYLFRKSSIEKLHDRRIFTNYFRLKTGNSFTYFKNNNKVDISSSTELTLDLLTEKNLVTNSLAALQDLAKKAEKAAEMYKVENNSLQKKEIACDSKNRLLTKKI